MLEKFCDILLIGTELTGLITSALLARRGMSVMVLPAIRKVGSGSSIEPHCFFPLNSLQLKSVLGRLGVSEEELPKKPLAPVSLQIVLPDHRVDLSTQIPVFHEELDREFPDEKSDILNLYQRLDEYRQTIDQERLEELFLPTGFFDRFKLKKLIKEYHLNQKVGDFFARLDDRRELTSFFECQLRHISDAFTENPFLYQMAKFISLSNQNACVLDGGIESLKRLLLQRIAEYGGEILDPRHIESMQFERGHLSSVVINGFEGSIHPKYALWNRPFADLLPYIPDRFRFRRFARRLSAFTPTHYRFCVQFSLPTTHWPVGMHDQVLYITQSSQASLDGENCLYIERQLESTGGRYLLSVHYMLPTTACAESAETFGDRHLRIRQSLSALMPFCDEVLELVFPIIRSDDSPLQETLFPLEKEPFELFIDAAKLHPVYQQQTESFIDLFQFNYKTPAQNLFLSSSEILIHFGLDGKVILAKKLAQLLRDKIQTQHAKALRRKKRVI